VQTSPPRTDVTAVPRQRLALIVSEYHTSITDGLEAGARAALADAGWQRELIDRFPVPGAYELAQAAQQVAQTGLFAGVVCLGCLIRGETPHFDYIAHAAAHGMMRAAQSTGVPVAFGLLTANTLDEAVARSGPGHLNKGREAALAAVSMVRLYHQISGGGAEHWDES
jgi:6,7-dimethyl-8-ribityllumazine synthase